MESATMKSTIFNLIILDESGSMSHIKSQTIDGCNETINTIKSAQLQFADTQEHLVSIYAFQSNDRCPSRYIIKNMPARDVAPVNGELYEPWGATPLYDAIGETVSALKAQVDAVPGAIGSVTIITDGYENSSRRYSLSEVARMISALKEMGWNFNFIGANIDVDSVAADLNIDNTFKFEQSNEGAKKMWKFENLKRQAYYVRLDRAHQELRRFKDSISTEELRESQRKASEGYFDDDSFD